MIDFTPSEEQQMISDTVAAFARDSVRPVARDADEAGAIPEPLVQTGWELGLVQSVLPEEFGGFGGARSTVTGALAAEELAYGDLSLALHLMAPRLLVQPVLDYGTQRQREKYLRPFADGTFHAVTAAVMEPRIDFDLSALTTTARRDGSSYVLSGHKCLVPLGTRAETFLIYATTDPTSGYSAVEGFLVPRGTPGLIAGEREQNMGLRGLDTTEVVLDNCRLPLEARLGEDGGCDFQRIMDASRIALGALAVGVARGAYDFARQYAKERKAFGRAIAQNQAIAFMLAEMATEIDAVRLLVWEAAWSFDQGNDVLRESYLAKRYAADMALKVTDNALQVLGGHGYIREYPVELWLRNARGFGTFEGLAVV
jgi:alkylation response protein AidB-like acyl-CoA dehydrogenase